MRAIIERNDLRELIKLYDSIGIGAISRHTYDWSVSCYMNLTENKTSINPRLDWSMRSQVLDSILTHKEWICRVKTKRDLTLSIEEVN